MKPLENGFHKTFLSSENELKVSFVMSFMKLPSSLKHLALVQASGVALYCTLIGTFMFNIEKVFVNTEDNFAGPIAFLLLFSTSVLVCALLVFYKPYMLFFDGKKKEALNLVLHTTGWLFSFFLIFISIAIFIK